MKAKDIMSTAILTVSRDEPILEAAKLMLRRRVSGLPVVDAAGDLVGIVTEADFMHRAETETIRHRSRWMEFFLSPGKLADEYAHASGRRVDEVMTAEVHTMREDTSLEDVVRLMERHGVKRMPVVAGKKPIGMVTRSDIMRAFVGAAQNDAQPKATDRDIRECVLDELTGKVWAPRAVDVSVTDGVVRLTGLISDERQRRALCVAAENVPGVKRIDDRLSLVDSLAEPVED